jgi:hypothetical protein
LPQFSRPSPVPARGRQSRSPERPSAVIPADLKSGVQRCDVARGCLAERLLSAMTVAGAVDPKRAVNSTAKQAFAEWPTAELNEQSESRSSIVGWRSSPLATNRRWRHPQWVRWLVH